MEYKKHIVIAVITVFFIQYLSIDHLFAQQDSDFTYSYSFVEEHQKKTFFVGFGSGLNYYTGFIGVDGEVAISKQLSINGSAGIGLWGGKLGGGMDFYVKEYPYHSSLSIGYSIASGYLNFETEMDVVGYSEPQPVVLDLHRAGTLNLAYTYNLKIWKYHKMSFSAGYAIPTNEKPYKLKTAGLQLSDLSEGLLEFLQPGGFLFGIKMMIGL